MWQVYGTYASADVANYHVDMLAEDGYTAFMLERDCTGLWVVMIQGNA
jgi:hypothetical protein